MDSLRVLFPHHTFSTALTHPSADAPAIRKHFLLPVPGTPVQYLFFPPAASEEANEETRKIEEERQRIEAERAAEEARRAAAVIAYSDQDYELLTQIVEAEAGSGDIRGRILVANVVINRVNSGRFPNTIHDVVYQKSQFSPVYDGRLFTCRVTQQTVEAVDRALAGEDYSQGALFFMNRGRSSARNVSWFDNNLTFLFQHDRHEFFK